MKYKRKDLEEVSKEFNEVLCLEPPIDLEIIDKLLFDDIKDVFENVLEEGDVLSEETEKILLDIGLKPKRINCEIDIPDEVKETEKPNNTKSSKKAIKEKLTKKKKDGSISLFVNERFKNGNFDGMKNTEIAELVRNKFGSKTTPGSIGVYKCKLKKAGLI